MESGELQGELWLNLPGIYDETKPFIWPLTQCTSVVLDQGGHAWIVYTDATQMPSCMRWFNFSPIHIAYMQRCVEQTKK